MKKLVLLLVALFFLTACGGPEPVILSEQGLDPLLIAQLEASGIDTHAEYQYCGPLLDPADTPLVSVNHLCIVVPGQIPQSAVSFWMENNQIVGVVELVIIPESASLKEMEAFIYKESVGTALAAQWAIDNGLPLGDQDAQWASDVVDSLALLAMPVELQEDIYEFLLYAQATGTIVQWSPTIEGEAECYFMQLAELISVGGFTSGKNAFPEKFFQDLGCEVPPLPDGIVRPEY